MINIHQNLKLRMPLQISNFASVSFEQTCRLTAFECLVHELHDLRRVMEHRVEDNKVSDAVLPLLDADYGHGVA